MSPVTNTKAMSQYAHGCQNDVVETPEYSFLSIKIKSFRKKYGRIPFLPDATRPCFSIENDPNLSNFARPNQFFSIFFLQARKSALLHCHGNEPVQLRYSRRLRRQWRSQPHGQAPRNHRHEKVGRQAQRLGTGSARRRQRSQACCRARKFAAPRTRAPEHARIIRATSGHPNSSRPRSPRPLRSSPV